MCRFARWLLDERCTTLEHIMSLDSKSSQINPILLKYFESQGFSSKDIDKLQSPDYSLDLHDPELLPGIALAVPRIWQAMITNQKILVFADYDADGLPGAAILATFFSKIGFDNYTAITPRRNVEGFSLKPLHVEQAIIEGVNLLITIDCGSNAHEAIQLAIENNIDVIVTDHHEVDSVASPEINIQPLAIINPKVSNSAYPFKELCGSGVIFKVVQALVRSPQKPPNINIGDGWDKWLLDLVAVATIGDMVSLRDENRTMVIYGLKVLNQTRNHGLRALIDVCGLERGTICADDVSFRIAPRINAASRMGFETLALDLLIADNPLIANRLAAELEKLNDQRKNIVTNMVKQSHKRLGDPLDHTLPLVIIGDPDWLPGMCGLLASRLSEEYQCPAFVWGRGESELLKGSCRSFGGVDVYQLMKKASEIFINFGGHVGAGGFSISPHLAHELEGCLIKAMDTTDTMEEITPGNESPLINVIDISLSDVDNNLLESINFFEPYGPDFPRPLFRIISKKTIVTSFGKRKEHLKLTLKDQFSGQEIQAIKWQSDPDKLGLEIGEFNEAIEVIGALEIDSYTNKPRLNIQSVTIL